MSVQKIETVKKSRKAQGHCTKCGDELPAGSGYLYWYPGFRSNYKIVRCLKADCYPMPSERETSKAATILAAQESFHNLINRYDSVGDIQEAVQAVAEAVQEVADEYQEALDQWENGNEQLQEKVDHYTDQSNEIDGWEWDGADEPDLCDEHGSRSDWEDEEIQQCEDCQNNRSDWLEEVRDAAREAVGNVETI
jgi:DNA repair ATPase RecN